MNNKNNSNLIQVTHFEDTNDYSFTVFNPSYETLNSLLKFWKIFDNEGKVKDQVVALYKEYLPRIPSFWLTDSIASLWEPEQRSLVPVIFLDGAPGSVGRLASTQVLGLEIDKIPVSSNHEVYQEFYEKFMKIVESCSI